MSITYNQTITKNKLEIRPDYNETMFYDELRHQYCGLYFQNGNRDYETIFDLDQLINYYTKKRCKTKVFKAVKDVLTSDDISKIKYYHDDFTLSTAIDYYLEISSFTDLFELLDGFGGLEFHKSRGYGQGDYIETLSEVSSQSIDQYLWDTPYWFCLKDDNGEIVDSCGGFYDLESIKEYLPDEYKELDLTDFVVND